MILNYEIGIDIADHNKFERFNLIDFPNFYDKVYTEAEIEYCRGKIARFAGIFAAKEACFKAFSSYGTTFISQFEILHERGNPKVNDLYHDNKVGIITIEGKDYWVSISISHGGASSVAMALAGRINIHDK